MIDITCEEVVTLAAACELKCLPRRRFGKKPHVATMYRWATKGARGVKLETLRVGGTLCTSVAALQRFFEALSEKPRNSACENVAQQAGEELKKIGI